jgi:hypothetical protein
MTTTVVRPDATASGGASFTVTGAPTAHAATNDSSDASYIRKAASGTASIILGHGTVAIASGNTVRAVRVRARVAGGDAGSKANLYLGTRVGGLNFFTTAVPLRGAMPLGVISGAWHSNAPDGGLWTQEKINNLRAQFTDYMDGASRAYLYEVYIDVDLADQPTTTVTAPTGSITTTSLPDVSWTYSDSDSEAQAFYRVKVFTAAQYGASGFDPETAASVWDSGDMSSVDTTTTVADYLGDGTYRVYVKTAKTINGSPFWSTWAYSGFTVNLTQPAIPIVAAVWSEALGKSTVTITGAVLPGGFASQVFELYRSDDGGSTWVAVRGGLDLEPDGSYVVTVADYEAPRGQMVAYRARAVGLSSGNLIASAWSASSTAFISNDGNWWLKSPTSPSLNIAAARVLTGLELTQTVEAGVFRPIGRGNAVVIEGSAGGWDGTYRVYTSSSAEWAALKALLDSQATILVQDPFGEQKYIRVVSRQMTQAGTAAEPQRTLQLGYVEVDA